MLHLSPLIPSDGVKANVDWLSFITDDVNELDILTRQNFAHNGAIFQFNRELKR